MPLRSSVRAVGRQLLPETIDNTYSGRGAALWIFALLLLMKLIMSVNTIFNGRNVASDADGIPIDDYSDAAAQTILAMFAIAAFAHLMITLAGILVLVRYRSAVPMMFALFLIEHLGRRLLLQFVPIVRVGSPPAHAVNLWLVGVMISGLALSLWAKRR